VLLDAIKQYVKHVKADRKKIHIALIFLGYIVGLIVLWEFDIAYLIFMILSILILPSFIAWYLIEYKPSVKGGDGE
jgi:hypothetical protein